MKYRILAVGLEDDLISQCWNYFSENRIEIRIVPDVNEVVNVLKDEAFHLLVLDMKYLRSIGQDAWIINIRYVSFISIVVLSDIPDADIGPTIKAGADACYDRSLHPSLLVLLLSAQLRRITEYNHFRDPDTVPFQVGDIAIDPARRLVWVRGQEVKLLPREFSLLLYFMRNPDIVLTPEQICECVWKKDYIQNIAPAIHNLRQKIEQNPSSPVYVKTVYRVGYYFTGYFSTTCDK